MKTLIIPSIALCFLLTACSKEVQVGGDEPIDVLELVVEAACDQDKEQMMACFAGSDAELAAIIAILDFSEAAWRFKEKFVEEYGEQAWLDFQDPQKAPSDGNATLDMFLEDGIREMYKITPKDIRIEGDKAYFKLSMKPNEIVLTREGGKWFIQASSLLPAGTQPQMVTKNRNNMATIVAKYEKAIGYKNITAEDIDVELGRAINKANWGISFPVRHRFDIDEIN